PDPQSIESSVRKGLKDIVRSSITRMEDWKVNPRNNQILHEFYYENGLSNEVVERIEDKINVSIPSFFESETFEEVILDGGTKFDIAERFRSFKISGIKVNLMVDLAYDSETGNVRKVIDWKTGSKSYDDQLQLTTYALYYNDLFRIPEEKIQVKNEYLCDPQEQLTTRGYQVSKEDLDRTRELIMDSFQQIYTFLVEEEIESLEDVLFIEGCSNEKVCSFCNFREVCFNRKTFL
ncbi:hypothetical protein D3H55_12365, partial [Bacillus salacetis]